MKGFISKAQEFGKGLRNRFNGAAVIALAGAALISVGVGMIYKPAGLITGGVLLVLAALDSRS